MYILGLLIIDWSWRLGCCRPRPLGLSGKVHAHGMEHGLAWALGCLVCVSALLTASASDAVLPCIYEGNLKTERDWFGFLANITIMTTGRMTFEFAYPAEKCCQNILFYLEDQVSILHARMNCWQKEALLRPEDDQILRLTPRFSWSGCHMSHNNGVSSYMCKGGRSFTAMNPGERTTTWYIGASNCASLQGLELEYRMEILGHIGECKTPYRIVTTPSYPTPSNVIQDGQAVSNQVPHRTCSIEGLLNTTKNWHGYIANVTLHRHGGFRFKFTYPYIRQVQNVILYSEEDVAKIREGQSCWQKEGVIRSRHMPDQIMDLSFRSSWNGCVHRNGSLGNSLMCQGERRFNDARTLYIAVNNCRSRTGLVLKYYFEFFGYSGSPCHGSSSPRPPHTRTSTLLPSVILAWVIASICARWWEGLIERNHISMA